MQPQGLMLGQPWLLKMDRYWYMRYMYIRIQGVSGVIAFLIDSRLKYKWKSSLAEFDQTYISFY